MKIRTFRTILSCGASVCLFIGIVSGQTPAPNPTPAGKVAPRPLYRDPPFDAPTDPVFCFNAERNKWFM